MPQKTLKVLYVVSVNAPTSVPLEAAGKMEELCIQQNISFYTAVYYKQENSCLKTNFVKNLIELNFKQSYSPKNIIRYYKLIRKINPDIIHLHHGVSAFQGAVLARLAGVKYVFKTEHNDHKYYKWYQKILTVPVFLLANRIICNSKSTYMSYYPWEKWIGKNKSLPIYNGINVRDIKKATTVENKNAFRNKFEISFDEKLFISVGRLIPQKNYSRLIKAMANVCSKNNNIKLVIVGGGEQEKQLKKIIHESQMEQNIFLTGTIQREKVYSFLNAADFFIISSLWEGFCNALVEAMAAGKPFLSSDIDTLREVGGDAAVAFFKPDSVVSIEEAITKAVSLTNKEREFFAAAAYRRAYDNFTIEKTATRYIQEYNKCYGITG